MAFTAIITGSVFALDPIYSVDAYARTVFQENIDKVVYGAEGTELKFSCKHPITLSKTQSDLKAFVERLIPDSANGRKVSVNILLQN